jgi:hypothetical protein
MEDDHRSSYLLNKYKKINDYIEKESDRYDFDPEPDIDGTTAGYMELLVLDFSVLNILGILFPLSFPVFMLITLSRMKAFKMGLFYLYRRPLPKGASDIGIYNKLMYTMSYAQIICYPALICFTSDIN